MARAASSTGDDSTTSRPSSNESGVDGNYRAIEPPQLGRDAAAVDTRCVNLHTILLREPSSTDQSARPQVGGASSSRETSSRRPADSRRTTALSLVEPLTTERTAGLRRRLGEAMDAMVVMTRPKADHATTITRALDVVTAFLDEAHELAAAPDAGPDAGTMCLDPQELWVRADRALVEAYTRVLCGNADAARAALGVAVRAALELHRALRRAAGCSASGHRTAEEAQ
jgi:hypothetical protein